MQEKSIFITIWTSRKEFQRLNVPNGERVDTRDAIKRYRV